MRPAGRAASLLVSFAIGIAATVVAPASQRDAATSQAAPAVQFENVAAAAGIDVHHVNGASAERHLYEIMGSGGLFLDFDNDGWVDIFLVDGGSLTDAAVARRARHRLFRNRGNGAFEDVTDRSGIVHRHYGMGACAADYDNSGFTDIYITNVGPNVLYRNNGDGTFTDVTEEADVAGPPVFSASCAFADIDGSGFVDLYVTNYVDARLDNNIFCGDAAKPLRIYCHPINFAPLPDVLFRNDGDGRFTDVTRTAGMAGARGNGLGVVFGDYDDDGRPDLFVANDGVPDFLYHNDRDGAFTEVGLLAGVSVGGDGRARAGMGTDFGDYDGDGRLDLFVTNHELETHTLFRNAGQGLFDDVTFPSGLGVATLPYVGFGTLFLDYDSDGRLDIAIVNGHVMNSPEHFRAGATEAQRNLLLRNDGARFAEVGRQSGPGFALEKISRTLAAGDIDNDGNLDLLVTNNGGGVDLLRSAGGHGHNGLIVRLVGTRGNRDAVGARLLLTSGGVTQVREVKAGSGYLGQHDLRVHVGLGRSTRVERLEIRWPGGATEVVPNVEIDRIVTVVEGKGMTGQTPFATR